MSVCQDQLGGPQIMVPNGVTHQAMIPWSKGKMWSTGEKDVYPHRICLSSKSISRRLDTFCFHKWSGQSLNEVILLEWLNNICALVPGGSGWSRGQAQCDILPDWKWSFERHIMHPCDETRDFRFAWNHGMPCRQEFISWVTNSLGAARACPLFWIGWALCPRTRVGSAGHMDTYLCLNNLQKVYESYTGIQQDQPEIWFAHHSRPV